MKIQQILEAKKGVKAPKYAVKPRNFVAKNAITTTSGAGVHKDKKAAEKKGEVKHKGKELAEGYQVMTGIDKERYQERPGLEGPFTAKNGKVVYYDPREGKYYDPDSDFYIDHEDWKAMNENAEYDDEAGMADNNLETLKRAVEGLDDMINEGDNLPEWCQEKIAVAKSMLISVWDYMQSEENSVSENSRNPDTMSATDYDRYQQSQMDSEKRNFKRDEMDQELGDEDRGMYWVVIAKNGKWEHTKAQPRQEGMNAAQSIITSLHAKYPSMHLGMVGPDGKVYNYGRGK